MKKLDAQEIQELAESHSWDSVGECEQGVLLCHERRKCPFAVFYETKSKQDNSRKPEPDWHEPARIHALVRK